MANEIIRPSALETERTSPVASEFLVTDNETSVAKVTIEKAVKAGRPAASKSEAETGTDPDKVMTPLTVQQKIDYEIGKSLASKAQGDKADTAVQPGDLATVATSGDYDDLNGKPTLGNSAALDIASQAQAEAGVVNDKGMTPLTTRQAVGGYVPEMYPALATHLAIRQAIIDAAANGSKAVLRPGKVYTIEAGIALVDVSVNLDFNGARLVRSATAANEVALSIAFTPTSIQAVSSITSALYDFGGGSTSPCSALVVEDGSAYPVGRVIRVVSDDLLPENPVADSKRMGLNAIVGAVVGNTVYTLSPLREAFTTNIRVGLMTDKTVQVDGANISDAPGYPANRARSAIRIDGAVKPRLVRPNLHDLADAAIELRGCHAYEVDSPTFDNLRTSAANGAVGYGVVSYGSNDGVVHSPRGSRMRHVYTTGSISVAADSSDLLNYGAAIGDIISNGDAVDCESSPWDTHEDALGVTFINCRERGGFSGPSTGGTHSAFNIRGRSVEIYGGGGVGRALVSVYSFLAVGNHHKVKGAAFKKSSVDVQPFINVVGTGYSRPFVEVDVDYEGNGDSAVLIDNADVKLRLGGNFAFSGGASRVVDLANGATCDFSNSLDRPIDLSAGTGALPSIVRVGDSSCVFRAGELHVKRGAGAWYLARYISANNGRATFEKVFADVATAAAPILSPGTSAIAWVRDLFLDQGRVTSGEVIETPTYGVAADRDVSYLYRAREVQVLTFAATAAGNRILTIPNGVRVGDRVIIAVRAASTQSIALASSGGSFTLASDVAISPGRGFTVVWNGTSWIGAA